MSTSSSLCSLNLKTCILREPIGQFFLFGPATSTSLLQSKTKIQRVSISASSQKSVVLTAILGAGVAFTLPDPASAVELQRLLTEPANALSLPTWAVHVSSVIEWIIAMALVWQYAEVSGNESWKGLSWGMVPLLGGAFCACTWHFFYNSESLEVLVALQAALTVLGNCTMCLAALRIYKSVDERSNRI